MTQQVDSERPRRALVGDRPLLIALGTVLAWNLVALAGWLAYVVVDTRQDPDWGDLVAIVSAMIGLGGFLVSLSIGSAVAGVWSWRGRWREQVIGRQAAVGFGTVAAAAGLAPFILYVINAVAASQLTS
jgi:hypothetical protein